MDEKQSEAPTQGATHKEIQYHYDVSNTFYQHWLDPSLTYSAALWHDSEDLFQAQLNKIDFHIQEARATTAKRVLDIGCGWGSTLVRLHDHYNCPQPIGLTLSQNQLQKIRSYKKNRIQVSIENWQHHHPKESYDAMISIGAFEHFARPGLNREKKISIYKDFFSFCHSHLKPEGRLSLQTIAYGELFKDRPLNSFIFSSIFPGSDLPRLTEIETALSDKFQILRIREDAKDYEKTCLEWLSRLKANKEKLLRTVTQETIHRYEVFLRMSASGFRRGALELYRLTLVRL